MNETKKQFVKTIIQSAVLSSVVVTLLHFALQWFRDGGAQVLGL